MELWLPIDGYPNYEASSDGRIRNAKTRRILKPQLNNRGYFQVSLSKDNKEKSFRVHRLVADTFYDGDHSGLDVNHIDGDKTNNHIYNLEFCTRKYNTRHAYDNNLATSNLNDTYRKMGTERMKETCSKPVRILETGDIYPSVNECARQINGSSTCIGACCKDPTKSHHNLHFEFV